MTRSVLQGKEACNTRLDPLGLQLITGQLKIEHEVGGMTCRGQSTVT